MMTGPDLMLLSLFYSYCFRALEDGKPTLNHVVPAVLILEEQRHFNCIACISTLHFGTVLNATLPGKSAEGRSLARRHSPR